MARNDARPLTALAALADSDAPEDDSEPSDVDLLVFVQVLVHGQDQDQQDQDVARSTPIPESIRRAVWQAERVVGEAQVQPAGQRARVLRALESP